MPPGVSAWDQVHALAREIPRGRVMNYGQIAELLKRPLSARAVGWAMRDCPDDVPWHRVVNAKGGLSTQGLADLRPGLQRSLLESEGIEFRQDGTLSIERYRWHPETRRAPRRRKK